MRAKAVHRQLNPVNAWKKLSKCLTGRGRGGTATMSSTLEWCVHDDSWGGGLYIFRETTFFLTPWLCVASAFVYFLIQGLWKQLAVCVQSLSRQLYLIKMSLTLKLHIYAVLTSAWWQSSHLVSFRLADWLRRSVSPWDKLYCTMYAGGLFDWWFSIIIIFWQGNVFQLP